MWDTPSCGQASSPRNLGHVESLIEQNPSNRTHRCFAGNEDIECVKSASSYTSLFVILPVTTQIMNEGKESLAVRRTALDRRASPRCPDGRRASPALPAARGLSRVGEKPKSAAQLELDSITHHSVTTSFEFLGCPEAKAQCWYWD